MTIIAIIPARAGSKRLPRKNLLEIAGRPLIEWTIKAALESEIFDQVIVSSDGDEILRVAEQNEVTPHRRPDKLSTDSASSTDVLINVIETFPSVDFCLLQPTSPLRQCGQIKHSFSLYQRHSSTCLVSVCELDHPIQWSGTLSSSGELIGLDLSSTLSQDIAKRYRLNGAIYWRNTRDFLETSQLVTERPLAFEMTRESSVDIDEFVDFKLAEQLLLR